ncbi:MAG TPA: pilus assembly protein [Pseudolabrys sp.]|nr:pilus assembly protein [Pseudolabrys sp.]
MKTRLTIMFRTGKRFLRERNGNVAVIFALALIPVIAATGAAVDYSVANANRAHIQSALDSTALMLAKEASSDSSEQLTASATKYFKAMTTSLGATDLTITASYTTQGGSSISLSASGVSPTTFMRVLGYEGIPVGAHASTRWGMSRLRVALVLDNTGSMADNGKMAALQIATKNLLSQLSNAARASGDVYVSIIPFVKDVNLDGGNYNDDWVLWDDGTDKSWDGANGTCSLSGYSPRSKCVAKSYCSISGYASQSACTAAGVCSISGYSSKSTCTSAGICSHASYTTQSKCTSKGYTWHSGVWTAGVWAAATWTHNDHSTWNGCVMDRGGANAPAAGNYDTNVVSPSIDTPATLFAAEQYASCPQEVMGLSDSWSAMNSLVDKMSPGGNTNQAIGLALGWMSLTGGGPFTAPALDLDYTYTQVIILLTDGLNTQDRWYTTQSQIDARQQMTCANIKAAGITLYTIQVNTGGDPTSSLLKSCASSSDKFFLLTSANEIISAFDTIGTSLSKLYVAK